jgi:hypothetical protein
MAGFGDNSTCFMREGRVPAGGLRIEAGCWTQTSDATAHIPTKLTEIFSFICGSATPNEIPDISNSFIKCGLSGTPSVMNYIAVGI